MTSIATRTLYLGVTFVAALASIASAAVVDEPSPAIPRAASKQTVASRDQSTAVAELPRKSQLIAESRSLLRAESKASSLSEQIVLTIRMVDMSYRFASDPRYGQSPTLQEARGLLHSRLRAIKKRTLTAQRRNKKKPAKIKVERKVLAQLNRALNGPAANGNNGGLPPDHGPMLVELIQRTISPSSWDLNGGASSIRYWRPGMALVVRAPGGVHEKVRPVVQQLRVQ